jgi:hypothetical protein
MPAIPKVYAVTRMYLDPSSVVFDTNTATVGTTFTVDILVEDVTDIAAAQIRMYFDDTILNATTWYEPTGDPNYIFYLRSTLAVPGAGLFAKGVGYAQCGITLFPAPSPGGGFTGSGLVMTWEFEILQVPAKGDILSCILGINNADTQLIQADGSQFTFDKQDGSYEITWATPTTNPHLAVDPALEYDQWTIWNCTNFDVDIYIMNLDAAWGLTNASFTVYFDEAEIDYIGAVVDPAWDGPNSVVHPVDGQLDIVVRTSGSLSGNVLVVTLTFHIVDQEAAPPQPPGSYEDHIIDIEGEVLWDHAFILPIDPEVDGTVRVYSYQEIPLPWIEVEPVYQVFGPEPVVGTEFDVAVKIYNLFEAWNTVAFTFRLGYDDTILEAVSVTEGGFLTDPQWNAYGTLFWSFLHEPPDFPDQPYWNVLVGSLLQPNLGTGTYDQFPPAPNTFDAADNTLAIIRFRIIDQLEVCEDGSIISPLALYPVFQDPDEWLMDSGGNFIPVDYTVDGEVEILNAYTVGRVIDVWVSNYPDGYNGKGQDVPSDMFYPQKEVFLCAEVTYNCWPVQQKLVTFNVFDPFGGLWTQLIAYTNEDGIACVSFRLPWPCDDPETLFGVWHIEVDVDIACVVVRDTLDFHFDYLVNIIEVTTDKYYYCHCEWVHVTVKFTSHAQQTYEVVVRVTIHDELNVPVATAYWHGYIGGAEYCTPNEYQAEFDLHIEKFVFVGYATLHVTPRFWYDGGWTAAGPEATEVIYVLPC